MKRLRFRAGRRILEKIRDEGLSPEDVRVIPGAAGGPKWLVLAGLDRFIFGTWLKESTGPVDLVGGSAGAWRFAAACQSDPVAALDELEEAYIHQRYSGKPGPEEVSAEVRKILEAYVTPGAVADILRQPARRLNVVTVRSRNLTASDSRLLLTAGFGAATVFNTLSRGMLPLFMERVVFGPDGELSWLGKDPHFETGRVSLTPENTFQALFASGSIPFVMARVAAPEGAPPGWYRDGGLSDYHMDLPYEVPEGKVVLYPHFISRVIPGWLDKFLPWRRAREAHMQDVLLVHPSKEFVESLPMKKIPDRNDFYTLENQDEERFRLWKETVKRSRELADEFAEVVGRGSFGEMAEPL